MGTNPAVVATAYPLFRELSNEDYDAFEKELHPEPALEEKAEKCTDEYYALLGDYDALNERVIELERKLAEKEAQPPVVSYEKEYHDLLISIAAEAAVGAKKAATLEAATETYSTKSIEVLKELIPLLVPDDTKLINSPKESLTDVEDPRPSLTDAALQGASPKELGESLEVTDEEDDEGITLFRLVFGKEEKPTP